MDVLGATRSRLRQNYALITPDTHVVSPLVGWDKATAAFHITPELGARFTQYTAKLEAGGAAGSPHKTVERFIFVLEGSVTINGITAAAGATPSSLPTGGYAYFPAGAPHQIHATSSAKLFVIEKFYSPPATGDVPRVIIGSEPDIVGQPFLGDPDARLQTLLPIEPAFDMAVNIFTYQPGATLPQVEIHVMEHGLMMLAGAGVYRLGDDYYPVAAGDVIWMASFCPQWFVAMGKQPARYIYYKDIHRDGLEDRQCRR